MKFSVLTAIALLAAAGGAHAAASVDLEFNGSGNNLAATGFEGVYNEDTTGYNVTGGKLTINIQPGDIYGDFEHDPDSAKNVFYSSLDATANTATTVDAKATVSGLSQNFHGGGILIGTDEDHYIRLGLINNGNNAVVEALREDEDIFDAQGPGHGDIIGAQSGPIAPTPLASPQDIYLRLIRDGSTAQAFYSLDGVAFTQVGGIFDNIATGLLPGGSEEGGFKVGAYAFGGPPGQPAASVAFDYLRASQGNAVPEPGSLALLASAAPFALAALRRRRAR